MSVHGPQDVFLLVSGIELTGDAFTLSDEVEQTLEETHTFGDTMEEQLPIGIGKVMLEQGEGLYDDRVAGFLEACQSVGDVLQYTAWGMEGYAPGDGCTLAYGTYVSKFATMAKRDGLTMAKPTHTITGAPLAARVVSGLTSRTSAASNTEATPDDVGAGSKSTPIVSSGTDDVFTTSAPHGLAVNNEVIVAGHTGSTPAVDGYYLVDTVGSTTTFKLKDQSTGVTVNITVAGAGGTVKPNPFPAKVAITGSSDTTERVTTGAAHGLVTGDRVLIAGHSGSTPDINGYHTVTVFDTDEFSMDDVANITVAGTGGIVRRVSSRTAYADLHVTALTLGGYTNLALLYRHSDDGSTWATAGTFAVVTAAGTVERLALTNLRRFSAVSWTYGGAGSGQSFTAFVGTWRG